MASTPRIEVQLVFQRFGDGEISDQIPSVMDDMPKLGDRFTYDGARWQVRSIEEVPFEFDDCGLTDTYVYLTHEDPQPRA